MAEKDTEESRQSERNKEINRIRAKWLTELGHVNAVGMAFELEMCLKAIDRFFNIKNLPLPEPDKAITFNFVGELGIVLDYINRVIDLTKDLLEAAQGTQVFQFRKYIETTLMSDLGRAKIREASYEQKSPNESLFLLYTGFVNLRGIVKALLKGKKIAYPLFVNVGNFINREVIANRFFNPVGPIEFRPEFDRIENRRISRIVMRIGNDKIKKNFSMGLLVLFRLLKYLDFINSRSNQLDLLRRNMPVFALIRSESVYLTDFFERLLPFSLEKIAGDDEEQRADLISVADGISFQLSMELKKIYGSELLGATRTKDIYLLRGAIENSQGILSNFYQQSIIQLVKVFEPKIEGRDIFKTYVSKLRQSLQLRNDIFVFKELMERFEEQAETNPEEDTKAIYRKFYKILRDYILYFRHESFNLLRYDDMREFNNFFDFMEGLSARKMREPDSYNEFIYKSKFFKIFLETTLSNINLRNELKNRPIDYRACERFLKEFIVASMRKEARKSGSKRKGTLRLSENLGSR